MQFKDNNFKLSVISSLLQQGELKDELQVVLDKYHTDEYWGYEPIPEILNFFNSLEISQEMLDKIEIFSPDDGDDIYFHLIPHWEGEDERFDITSIEDIVFLRNLKEVHLYSMTANKCLNLAPLLQLPNLTNVTVEDYFYEDTDENKKVIDELTFRGVKML